MTDLPSLLRRVEGAIDEMAWDCLRLVAETEGGEKRAWRAMERRLRSVHRMLRAKLASPSEEPAND